MAAHCSACGFAQGNHLALWVSNTGDVLTMRLPTKGVPFARLITRLGDLILSLLGRGAFLFARLLGLVTLSDDEERTCSDRSRLLLAEGKRRGLDITQLFFFGNPTDTFRVRKGGRTRFFKSLPLLPPPDALRMDDKVLFKSALAKAGLPVPRSYSATNLRSARRALSKLSLVCVKPRAGSNGRHTYPYVRTDRELREALAKVQEICAFASVEEHLEGNLCRATCVGGTLVGFLESHYPSVTGDGVSTVEELVAKANAKRLEGVAEIKIDAVVEGFIGRQGYERDSVLSEGETLQLSYRAGASSGGSNREHGRNIHPSFIAPIEEAAKLTGLEVVGFDLIVPDAKAPEEGQRWGFIEANTLPWIDLHAAPYYGDPIDLSSHVWDLWEAREARP